MKNRTLKYVVQLYDPSLGLPRVWGKGPTLAEAKVNAAIALDDYLVRRHDLRRGRWRYDVKELDADGRGDGTSWSEVTACLLHGWKAPKVWTFRLSPKVRDEHLVRERSTNREESSAS